MRNYPRFRPTRLQTRYKPRVLGLSCLCAHTNTFHSPDDQRILEEAFARNPRPSKEERAEIINRVALGDKEVQVLSASTVWRVQSTNQL